MTETPSSSPFILITPNEILHHVFSFLPDPSDHDSFVRYHADGKDHKVSQMLLLRSVCRLFRAIAAELDFWYDAEFLFGDLASPNEHRWDNRFLYNQQEERFLKVL